MNKIQQKGFTLIELIVVIAIIGVLSSVIIISVNSVNAKKANSSIKANMKTITNQAEIYIIDNNNSYLSTGGSSGIGCGENLYNTDRIKEAIVQIKKHAGVNNIQCYSSNNSYAVSTKLVGTDNQYLCVDSFGNNDIVSQPISSTQTKCQ